MEQQEEKKFDEHQQRAIDLALSGKSFALLGEAGMGKTAVINEIVKRLPSRGVFITASTGSAASIIAGITLHSFASIGLGEGTKEELLKTVMKKPINIEKWKNCTTLI